MFHLSVKREIFAPHGAKVVCPTGQTERKHKKMVEVNFDRSRDRYIISVEGHAGYGAKGEDVVCAAVSVLTFTLFRAIQEFDHRGGIERFYHSISDGNAQFDFSVKESFIREVRATVDGIFEGFFLLEENFPCHVRVY